MKHIPDLGKIKERQDALDQIKAEKEAAEAIERVHAWNENMQRAFKGIITEAERHAMLQRAKFDADE